MEVHRLVGVDQEPQQFAGFLEAVLALLHRREGPTVGFVLALVPARPDGEGEPSLGRGVDGARDLRDQGRVAVRIAQHQVAKPQLLRHAARDRDRREALEGGHRLLLAVGPGRNEVVRKPDAVPVAGLHGFHGGANVLPRCSVDVYLYSEVQDSLLNRLHMRWRPRGRNSRAGPPLDSPYAVSGSSVQCDPDGWAQRWSSAASRGTNPMALSVCSRSR